MRSLISTVFGASVFFGTVSSLPSEYGRKQARQPGCGGTARAAYFQSNNPAGNTIVALSIAEDGKITDYTTTETCGNGSAGVLGTGEMATVDALFSQDSVIARENILLAVNAGSNTVSMFAIDPQDPTKLALVGTPQSTLGDFPNSIAYCPKLKRACVVNAGQKDGVTCYSVHRKAGLKCLDQAPRPLNIGQSTPPMGPAGTVSDIFFSPDSNNLLLTVKGNPETNTTGFVGVYPVKNGHISRNIIKSHPDNTTVLFGSVMTSPTEIFATDAAFGAAQLKLHPNGSVSMVGMTTIDGQNATCWAAKSPSTGSVYVTDVGQPRIIEIDPMTGLQLGSPLVVPNVERGFIDNGIGGDFLYNLHPSQNGTGVTVLDLSGGKGNMKLLETFLIPAETAGAQSMGMSLHA